MPFYQNSSSALQADVAIVGKGPAGVATALGLRRHGLSVVVIDRNVPRVLLGESLPPKVTPILQELGVWSDFLASGQRPCYGNRSTWGSAAPMETDFIHSAHGHGWHLHHPTFDRLLTKALSQGNIQTILDTRVLSCSPGKARRWSLALTSSGVVQRLGVDMVVDASGRSRQIVRMLGAERLAHDRLIGVVGILVPRSREVDQDSFTEIEAAADGWWYTSPLHDGRLVGGYMTDSDSETVKSASRPDGWMGLLSQTRYLAERVNAYGYRLWDSPRHVAASSSRLSRVTGDGWCAVGDAAASYDPLSSQGIVAALDAGLRVAHAIGPSHSGGLVTYEEHMQDQYARYIAAWLGYYALETRWSDRLFWRRRHQALQALLRN